MHQVEPPEGVQPAKGVPPTALELLPRLDPGGLLKAVLAKGETESRTSFHWSFILPGGEGGTWHSFSHPHLPCEECLADPFPIAPRELGQRPFKGPEAALSSAPCPVVWAPCCGGKGVSNSAFCLAWLWLPAPACRCPAGPAAPYARSPAGSAHAPPAAVPAPAPLLR